MDITHAVDDGEARNDIDPGNTRRVVRGLTGSAAVCGCCRCRIIGVWVSRGMAWPAVGVVGAVMLGIVVEI